MKQKLFQSKQVQKIFESYPTEIQQKLLYIRDLIFQVAAEIKEVGKLTETTRWGEPSYLTNESQSGTLIRIHHYKTKPFDYAVYFHCQTNLIKSFRLMFPKDFTYDGNRAITFMKEDVIPIQKLKQCIAMALTYHLKKD